MKRLVVLVLVLLAGACSGISKQNQGALIGAALGGWGGSTIGSGKGQLAATAAGTLLGALLGGGVGRSLDRADALYASRTTARALEFSKNNSGISWRNPNTGNYGTVAPMRTYRLSDGRYCREYQSMIIVGGRIRRGYGAACRQLDGSWRMISSQAPRIGARLPYVPPRLQSRRTQQRALLRRR